MPRVRELRFSAAPDLDHAGPRDVTGLLVRPDEARFLLVLGHGAGSHCRHALMEALAAALAARGVATFRFNYPYSERGGGMSSLPLRLATVRSAAREAARLAPDLPRFVGGHSMSGRMFSNAMATESLPNVLGVVLYAFPLHAREPDRKRAAHLSRVRRPLLLLSGDRDKMADPALLAQVTSELDAATLKTIDTADHSFRVLKRRRVEEDVHAELARETAAWMRGVLTEAAG